MTVKTVLMWMFLGVLTASGIYAVKFRVQTLKTEVAATETQLYQEKKNLHVLMAEWTYLNRPERLERLSARYLGNQPVQGRQLADVASLPVNAASLAGVKACASCKEYDTCKRGYPWTIRMALPEATLSGVKAVAKSS